MMDPYFEPSIREIFTKSAALVIALILFAFLFWMGTQLIKSHGQDLDKRYYCIEHPFYRSCDPQLQHDKHNILEIIKEACNIPDALCLIKDPS